ncbi:MAG: hypothetical protein DMD51_06105 [Gemmatimonadetes bacterium]|nr:MAG: hypothetical protein DMD32_11735 [Gemmatimonadota bacterium]PYP26277.1 MAG: hypothetical protein DMD51_06105 [Gemmatimonadota bacterium]
MDVHVYRVTREIEEQDQGRPVAGRNRRAVPGFRRAEDEGIADRSTTHEDIAFATRRPRLGGALGEAPYLERPRAVRDWEQGVGELGTPQGAHPVGLPSRGRHIDEGAVVAREGKRNVGTRQREHGEHFHDRPRLRRLGAQELAAGGCIEEQRAHRHRRATLPHGVRHRVALAPDHADTRAGASVRRCLELEAGHRRDRRERLAPKAERRHADQVRRITDLAGGVARQRQLRVLATHPFAVVAHPDERLAAVLDRHPNRARPRVERVLDELLDDRGRPLDHLACRDLVCDSGGQNGDLRRHSGTTSAASTQPRTPS